MLELTQLKVAFKKGIWTINVNGTTMYTMVKNILPNGQTYKVS